MCGDLITLEKKMSKIQLDYPFPISYCLKRYWDLPEDRDSDSVDSLLKIFEVNVKLLTSIASKHILMHGSYNEAFRARLSDFHRPSLGHWIEILRNAISGFNAISEKDDLTTHITKWANITINSNPEMIKAYNNIGKLISVNPGKGKINPLRIMDIICTFRNKAVAHGSRVSEIEYAKIHKTLKILVFHLIDCSGFLCNYDFCYVKEVKTKSGETFLTMRSSIGREFETEIIKSKVLLYDNRLYLMQKDEDKLLFALDLSPFVVFSNCIECKTEQIFFYNSSGKNREFLSYQCGHRLLFDNPEDDLNQIEKFLKGEIPISFLYHGRTLSSNFENIGLEDYKQSKKKVEEILSLARELISRNQFEQSQELIEKAITNYKDSPEAFYLKAIVLLQLEANETILLGSIVEACRLAPNNSEYSTLAMLIYLLLNDYEKSKEYASKTYSLSPEDSKNQKLNEAFSENKSLKDIVGILGINSLDGASILNFIQQKKDEGKLELQMWVVALPPWSLIKNRPLMGSILICLSYLAIILAVSPNELDIRLVIRITNITIFNLVGLYVPFVLPRLVDTLYQKLKPVVTFEEDVFHRWFYTQITPIIGSYHYVCKSQSYKIKQVYKYDKSNLLLYVAALLVFIPLQISCASGLDPFTFKISVMVRYSFYIFQIICGIWVIPYVINSLNVIPIFGQMPIKFFIDMPDAVSLKPVGTYYLKVAALGTSAFVLFTIQHYIFHTHIYVRLISISFIISISLVFFAIMFASQFLIQNALTKLRDKKLIQFSKHLESSFGEMFDNPTEATLSKLTQNREIIRIIRKGMPSRGLTKQSRIAFVLLSIFQVAFLAFYFFLVYSNIWFL